MQHSKLSFFIALIIHVALIYFFYTFVEIVPTKKPEEKKIEVTLQDYKKPISKKKLKKAAPTPKPKPKPKPKVVPKKQPLSKPITKKIKKPLKKEVKPKKELAQTKTLTKPIEQNQTQEEKLFIPEDFALQEPELKIKEEKTNLYDFLSQEDKKPKVKPLDFKSVFQPVDKLYGNDFHTFSKEEQKYIKEHLSGISYITQVRLWERGYPQVAAYLHQAGENIVEFELYPNGDISPIKLLHESGYTILDENSVETIYAAYKDYPHPKKKTTIRFLVRYIIY